MANSPYRNDGVTIATGVTVSCPRCGQPFTPVGRQRFCAAACRQAAWRRQHSEAAPSLPTRAPRPATVYECPGCGARFLGEQRCPDCNVFCRRVGPGGPCPHCDEPVALSDLVGAMDTSASPLP
jgi:ssDNA-binding Zn-finger/Zn-ribbon topoisomerase 1